MTAGVGNVQKWLDKLSLSSCCRLDDCQWQLDCKAWSDVTALNLCRLQGRCFDLRVLERALEQSGPIGTVFLRCHRKICVSCCDNMFPGHCPTSNQCCFVLLAASRSLLETWTARFHPCPPTRLLSSDFCFLKTVAAISAQTKLAIDHSKCLKMTWFKIRSARVRRKVDLTLLKTSWSPWSTA